MPIGACPSRCNCSWPVSVAGAEAARWRPSTFPVTIAASSPWAPRRRSWAGPSPTEGLLHGAPATRRTGLAPPSTSPLIRTPGRSAGDRWSRLPRSVSPRSMEARWPSGTWEVAQRWFSPTAGDAATPSGSPLPAAWSSPVIASCSTTNGAMAPAAGARRR
jgi:hypothetical protein